MCHRNIKLFISFVGADLDKLEEGDRVGVCRTGQGDLIFYVNGDSQGLAAKNIPKNVYALVNLYGKCGQVSIISAANVRVIRVKTEQNSKSILL